jgi:hypothetical protein
MLYDILDQFLLLCSQNSVGMRQETGVGHYFKLAKPYFDSHNVAVPKVSNRRVRLCRHLRSRQRHLL